MHRHAIAVVFLLAAVSAVSQSTPSATPASQSSDPQALSLARQAIGALTGGSTISDITLTANVTWIAGSDNETGTGVFRAKGTTQSRVDLTLSGGTRSEVRALTNGYPSGAWQQNGNVMTTVPQHNCWADAAWFFPALSSLAQLANQTFQFKYIGLEEHGGVNTQHIQVLQAGLAIPTVQKLSGIDFYLDPVSSLPLAVTFQVHADTDASLNIPAEVRFANYQTVNGVPVPFRIQRMLNGGVVVDITVSSVALNSGLSDSTFSLQ
jgi:hypothetical protein